MFQRGQYLERDKVQESVEKCPGKSRQRTLDNLYLRGWAKNKQLRTTPAQKG